MFIDLGHGVSMTDEQFEKAMAERRAMHQLTKNDMMIGCPLCSVIPKTDLELAEKALADAEKEVERAREAEEALQKAAAAITCRDDESPEREQR